MSSEHILGRGVLCWNAKERQSDRYGTVELYGWCGDDPPAIPISASAPFGRLGMLIARVVEVRQSRHVGDIAREIFPSTPTVGEEIILNRGILAVGEEYPEFDVGLIPLDGREEDWLDPHQLYRAIHQTVDLVFLYDESVGAFPARKIPVIVTPPFAELSWFAVPGGVAAEPFMTAEEKAAAVAKHSESYQLVRELPDGLRWAGISRQMTNCAIVIGPLDDPREIDEKYCYDTVLGAVVAYMAWAGDAGTEPNGWVRHVPPFGAPRRRPTGDASGEYRDW